MWLTSACAHEARAAGLTGIGRSVRTDAQACAVLSVIKLGALVPQRRTHRFGAANC